jgi:hypothetical protein
LEENPEDFANKRDVKSLKFELESADKKLFRKFEFTDQKLKKVKDEQAAFQDSLVSTQDAHLKLESDYIEVKKNFTTLKA